MGLFHDLFGIDLFGSTNQEVGLNDGYSQEYLEYLKRMQNVNPPQPKFMGNAEIVEQSNEIKILPQGNNDASND